MKPKLLMTLAATALFLTGCASALPNSNGDPRGLDQCPPSALVKVADEPLMPEGSAFNEIAERWLFGQLLPWARGNASGRERTRKDCEARLEEGA